MKTLIIYDNKGQIFSKMAGSYLLPQGGIQYLEVEIPDGKRIKSGIGIDVSVTPNVAILEDIPKTQEQILGETVSKLSLENADLKTQVQTLSQTVAKLSVN